jgi:type IV pilus assembly protein PilV
MREKLIRGFTLVEVLVTLVILTFGLLGIAGLMAKGQRIAFEAYQRQQAIALASDMAERIRGNRFFAISCPTSPIDYTGCTTYIMTAPLITPLGQGLFYGDYRTGTGAVKDCGIQICDGAQLVLYDIAMWDGLLNGYSEQQAGGGAQYGGIINARGCIEQLTNTQGTCPAPGTVALFSTTIRVSVAWQGNDDTVAPTAATPSCGAGKYTAETKRRIVTYDLLLQELCP